MKRLLLFMILAIGTIPQGAMAAQPMFAVEDEVPIFDAPKKDAIVLRRVFRATPFAASNAPIEGYFKVKTADGLIGFVLSQDVASSVEERPAAESPEEPTRSENSGEPKEIAVETPVVPASWPKHELRSSAGIAFYGVGAIQSRLSASMSLGWELGVEYRYQWRERVALLGRLDFLTLRGSTSTNLGEYDLGYLSIPLSVGGAYDFFRGENWRASFSALWGLGWKTRFEAELKTGAEPRITVLETTPFVQTLKLDFCRAGRRGIGFCFDAGWRAIYSSSVLPTTYGNGFQVLQLSGSMQPIDLGQSSFFVDVAVSWDLGGK